MPSQSYETHRHTPKPTALGVLFLAIAAAAFGARAFRIGRRATVGVGLAGLIASQFMALLTGRRYTTKLQDRIIKLEMKIRLGQLLSPSAQQAATRLSNAQLVALRFASDEEMAALVERAEREQLTPDQIKRAVKRWVPDFDRT
jgi:MFS family permease